MYVIVSAGKSGQSRRVLVTSRPRGDKIVTEMGTFSLKTRETLYYDSDFRLETTELLP